MYTITTTSGFIIESRPTGEAGKVLFIFTRELGLVRATAQGIRLEKSKLRYHTQEFSLGEFSFVRGKEYWRLTHADKIESSIDLVASAQELIARIALVLRRLLAGEEAHPELFEHIESLFVFLKNNGELEQEQNKTLESVIMYRILHVLGYIGTDKGVEEKITSAGIDTGLIQSAATVRVRLNTHINKALKESHL